ncbi:MAG: sensor domain-containing phosphodiesterase, partial [Alphaproteobacteria bacterium]|nr:sensor domain-containing phosphodiesterase [Alphaproteobacteria bacterium]
MRGHAAIVDHMGNVLSHPLPSWVAERRNIAKVSAVQRMMQGETGVETFFSPALKGDMIAGFTSVEPVGWGVMIPQPVDELLAKA